MSARQRRELLSGYCDVIQAIRAFNYALLPQEKGKLDQIRSWGQSASASQLVDAAVEFVRELEKQLGSHGVPLKWLYGRAENGFFPPQSFE